MTFACSEWHLTISLSIRSPISLFLLTVHLKGLGKRWLIELYLYEKIPSLRMQDIHIDKLVQFLPRDGAWHFEDELI